MHVVDHRLVGALHVDTVRRDAGDDETDDAVFQTSTIEALLDGAYEGDLTVGELLAHGDLGIGTVDHLDGELVVLDGEPFVVHADGSVRAAGLDEGTPFAAVVRFAPDRSGPVGPSTGFDQVTASVDALHAVPDLIAAVRIEGRFARLVVRSVARQHPPYPPLREVVEQQSEWELTDQSGTLVGFRFPAVASGIEVAGWHLHYLSADRRTGGHVIDVDLDDGRVDIDTTAGIHLELPDAVELPAPGAAGDREAEVRRVEGR